MKKIKLFIIPFIFILLITSISVGAYFSSSLYNGSLNVEYTDSNLNTIEISNINDLYKAIALDSNFNIESNLNVNEVRKNYKLVDDLSLTSDLYIYFPLDLNLNGYTLELNGYSLYFIHPYLGTYYLYNGNIVSNSQAYIYEVTPKGSLNISKNLTLDENVEFREFESNKTILLEYALNYIKLKLNNEEFDFYNSFESDNLEVYTIDDLDLPLSLPTFNISFNYKSSDVSIMKDNGSVLNEGSVVLNITAVFEDESISKNVVVNVIDKSNTLDIGLKQAVSFFDKYYKTEIINEEEVTKYFLTGPIVLQTINSYLDLDIIYHIYDENMIEIASSDVTSSYFEKLSDNTVYLDSLTASYIMIEIKNESTSMPSDVLEIVSEGNSSIVDNNTLALSITQEWFTSQIEITDDILGVNDYSTYELLDINKYQNKGLINATYSLSNNLSNIYNLNIEENYLYVNDSRTRSDDPSITSSVFLTIELTFSNQYSPSTVNVNIPIVYRETNPDETGVSGFRPYYVYFDRQITESSGGRTYHDFSIPFTFGSAFPVYYLVPEILNIEGEIINVLDINGNPVLASDLVKTSIYYNGNYYDSIDDVSLTDVVKNGMAKWHFTIDTSLIPEYDIIVSFSYFYSFSGDNYQTHSDLVSSFIIPGILRCGTNESFLSEELYQYIYQLYSGNTYQEGNFIETSWVNVEVDSLDFSKSSTDSTGLSINIDNITSFKGLEYLTGVKSLNMSQVLNGKSFSIDTITYISKMTSLKYLNLSNNNLCDRPSYSGFPSGTDNHFIRTLESLPNLTTLDLSNNKIYSFQDLTYLASLKEVYIYGNEFEWKLSFIITIDLSNIVNGIYGSSGALNEGTFGLLTASGVNIYIDSEGNIYQSSSNTNDLIYNLVNLEYQMYLEEGEDISLIYNALSTTPSDYTQTNQGNPNMNQDTEDSIKFSCDSEDPTTALSFKLEYSYKYWYEYRESIFQGTQTASETITYEMEYQIIRIPKK